MNPWDILVLALVGAAAALAVRATVRRKKSGRGCCGCDGCGGDCAACSAPCGEQKP